MRWEAPPLVEVRDDRPRIERRSAVRRVGEVTFYETRARVAIEPMPAHVDLPQRWAVNPYRGCAHGCLYCGARGGHRRLGLPSDAGFAAHVVVRGDVADRLRGELPRHVAHGGEEVAVGVGGDCYQPAEERYRLMPRVLAALGEAGVPFTVYTKSPRVLTDAAEVAACGGRVAVSVGFVDERVRRVVEPGAVAPQRRLELLAELSARGVACVAVMGPILPLLTDSPDQLAATVRRVAATGVRALVPVVLRLPPGAREAFMGWLAAAHPALAGRYAELYDGSGRPSPAYEARVRGEVAALAAAYRVGCGLPPPAAGRPRFPQQELLQK